MHFPPASSILRVSKEILYQRRSCVQRPFDVMEMEMPACPCILAMSLYPQGIPVKCLLVKQCRLPVGFKSSLQAISNKYFIYRRETGMEERERVRVSVSLSFFFMAGSGAIGKSFAFKLGT